MEHIRQYLDAGAQTPDEAGIRRRIDRAIAEGRDEQAGQLARLLATRSVRRRAVWRARLEQRESDRG